MTIPQTPLGADRRGIRPSGCGQKTSLVDCPQDHYRREWQQSHKDNYLISISSKIFSILLVCYVPSCEK